MKDNALISVRGLEKSFGKDIQVLKGIDIDIFKGDVVVVLGPSGSGKSTFLRCLNRLEEPTGGHIFFEGTDITDPKVNINVHRQKMGMVFQQFNLFNNMTVFDNCMAGVHKVKKRSKEYSTEICMKYLEKVGMAPYVKAKPHQLSGGMKQRVAIARAYAAEPEVLLMDEPFGALDAQTRTQLQTELLETWQREKKTCFFITHDVEEAIILAQTVIIMSARPGRIRDIVKIDIPYPRTQETKMTKEFMELKNEIWSQVYQEYLEVRK